MKGDGGAWLGVVLDKLSYLGQLNLSFMGYKSILNV